MKPQADAVAAEHGFGDSIGHWDVFDKGEAKSQLGCAGGLLVIALILAGVAWLVKGWIALVLVILAVMFVIGLLGIVIKALYVAARSGAEGAFLYRTGLVRTSGDRVSETIDLATSRVTEHVVQHYKGGVKSGPPEITFTITGAHGESKLRGGGDFGTRVLPVIKQTAAEARLATVVADLERGSEVTFHGVTLTPGGFRINGAEVIPYAEIESLTVSGGVLTVAYGTVNRREHSQNVGETPDFTVLSSLLSAWSGKAWA